MCGLICCDIEGVKLTPADCQRLKNPLVGMVILFTRNYESTEQLNALCDSIHALREDLLICVDHEGGRVQRFREGFTQIPAMRRYGTLYAKDKELALKAVNAAGFVLASELRSFGVDFTFAPCLDLEWNHSEIIGERSFSESPEAVSALAASLMEGFREAGMANCGKHFPGHGWAKADSHKALPLDERQARTILENDVMPYKNLISQLKSVMTAHVLYEAVDSVPASFSSSIVTGWIRDTLGFKGLIFSDDLTMKGAHAVGGIVERASKALAVGCDTLIICNDPESVDTLLGAMDWKADSGYKERFSGMKPTKKALDYETLKLLSRYKEAKELMFDSLE